MHCVFIFLNYHFSLNNHLYLVIILCVFHGFLLDPDPYYFIRIRIGNTAAKDISSL